MSCQELARSGFKALGFHLEEEVEYWERKFDINTSLKVRVSTALPRGVKRVTSVSKEDYKLYRLSLDSLTSLVPSHISHPA